MSEVFVVKYEFGLKDCYEQSNDGAVRAYSCIMSVCNSKDIAKDHIRKIVDHDLECFKAENKSVNVESKSNGLFYEILEPDDAGVIWSHRYGCMKYDMNVLDLDSLKS